LLIGRDREEDVMHAAGLILQRWGENVSTEKGGVRKEGQKGPKIEEI